MDSISGLNSIYQNQTPDLKGHKGKYGVSASEATYGIFNSDKGVNGKIDEGVFQGKSGDCWLISGVLSLSYTPEGRQIIKDSITKNKDGSYDVYFKGIDRSYNITAQELEKNNKNTFLSGLGLSKSTYSTGDDDMLLMELAVEKVVKEGEIPIETVNGITGGSTYYLYQILTDNQVEYSYGAESDADEIEALLNYYQAYQGSCAATIGVADGFANLEDDHAYAVKSYYNNTVTLVNPWDSTKDIKISADELLNNIGNYDISIVDNELKESKSYLDEYYA